MPDESQDRARTGKIARMPVAIRNEVNRRLFENESGARIVAWLNEQPEALKILEDYFGEEPVTPQNLSEWRKGGYQAWIRRREAIENMKDVSEFALHLGQAAGGSIGDGTAAILGGKILGALEKSDGDRVNPFLVEAVAMLRKGDHEQIKRKQADRLLDQKDEQIALDKKKFQRTTAELFLKFYEDKRAKEIVESRSTNAEKLELVGQAMFGEDW